MGMPLLPGRIPGSILPEGPGSSQKSEAGDTDTIGRVLTD